VEGMDKEFDGIIWRAVEIVRMIDGAKTCSKEECLIAAGWRAIETKQTKTIPNESRNDAESGDAKTTKEAEAKKKTEPAVEVPTPSRTSNRRSKSPKKQQQQDKKECVKDEEQKEELVLEVKEEEVSKEGKKPKGWGLGHHERHHATLLLVVPLVGLF
jgi:hypothetical protein